MLRCVLVSRKPMTGIGLWNFEGRVEIFTKGMVGLERT